MSVQQLNTTPETCEYVKNLEASAREVRRKAGNEDWASPVSLAYYQCALELRRLVHIHIAKGRCAACREDGLLPMAPHPQGSTDLGLSMGVSR
jgi:hypothetical protein